MEWISIKDKKPNDGEYCLVYAQGYGIGERLLDYYQRNGWCDLDDYVDIICDGLSFDMKQDVVTHWIPLSNIPIPNQPERSKREDLDCCKVRNDLEYVYDRYETYVMEHDKESSDILKSLLDQSKMRCSEHCGNTVRDK